MVADSLSRMHRRGSPSLQHYRHSRDAPGFEGGCSTRGMTSVHRGMVRAHGEREIGVVKGCEGKDTGGRGEEGDRPSRAARADRRARGRVRRRGATAGSDGGAGEHAVDELWRSGGGSWRRGRRRRGNLTQGDGRVGGRGGEQGAKRFRKARASRRQHCGPGVSQFAFDRQQRAFVSTAWST